MIGWMNESKGENLISLAGVICNGIARKDGKAKKKFHRRHHH
jgi:hypothetical protein